jgi:DNA-directed RNA polymerase specialized sigma24 family protein
VLVREHGNALLASIHAIAGPSHADDIFQDTVLVAWRRPGDYDRTRLRLPPP